MLLDNKRAVMHLQHASISWHCKIRLHLALAHNVCGYGNTLRRWCLLRRSHIPNRLDGVQWFWGFRYNLVRTRLERGYRGFAPTLHSAHGSCRLYRCWPQVRATRRSAFRGAIGRSWILRVLVEELDTLRDTRGDRSLSYDHSFASE